MENINDLYWLAGIIEGEGFLTTNKRQGIHKTRNGGEGSRTYITRVGVGNTEVMMIKKISEIYVKLGVKFYYTLHGNKKYEGALQYISINVEGYRSCLKLLSSIKDKMSEGSKKFQVVEMIKYIDYRLSKIQPRDGHGRNMSATSNEEFDTIDEVFVRKLHDLKIPSILPSTTKRIASTVLSW